MYSRDADGILVIHTHTHIYTHTYTYIHVYTTHTHTRDRRKSAGRGTVDATTGGTRMPVCDRPTGGGVVRACDGKTTNIRGKKRGTRRRSHSERVVLCRSRVDHLYDTRERRFFFKYFSTNVIHIFLFFRTRLENNNNSFLCTYE